MKIFKNNRIRRLALVVGLLAVTFTAGFGYGDGSWGRGWNLIKKGDGSDGCVAIHNYGYGVALGLKADSNDALWCDGSASFEGQIVSTVAEGTEPLVVTSTTRCENLNSDTVDGFHVATGDPNDPQLARRWFFSIPGGGTTAHFSIPSGDVCTITIGVPGAPPEGVVFLHVVESYGWIAWNGQDATGAPITGSASLSTVTPIVSMAYDTVVLETPGDGSARLHVSSLGTPVNGNCIW